MQPHWEEEQARLNDPPQVHLLGSDMRLRFRGQEILAEVWSSLSELSFFFLESGQVVRNM